MEPFSVLTAVAAPLVRANVDTDAIIPSREMKTVGKTGLSGGLFAGWRYTAVGGREPDPDFVLNRPGFGGAKILLGGENFGCGSSREHAVWALHEYGFRAIVAPSFSPIFRNNCVRNGIVPVELPLAVIGALAAGLEEAPGTTLTVDLPSNRVVGPDGTAHPFLLEEEAREMLLEGLDAIDLTLRNAAALEAFRAEDRARRPWVYLGLS